MLVSQRVSKFALTRNPLHIMLVTPPHVPPKDLLEGIKLLEFGKAPLPTLKLLSSMGEECLYMLEDDEGVNLKNFLMVYYARISVVPVTLITGGDDDWVKNANLLRKFNQTYTAERGGRFFDDNQLAGGGGTGVQAPPDFWREGPQIFPVTTANTDTFADITDAPPLRLPTEPEEDEPRF